MIAQLLASKFIKWSVHSAPSNRTPTKVSVLRQKRYALKHLEDLFVIACGPYGFPGASQIMCNGLRLLASLGVQVVFIGPHIPFSFQHFGMSGIEFRCTEAVVSNAIGPGAAVASQDVLETAKLAEAIAKESISHTNGASRTVVWGTYALPYGLAAILGADLIGASGTQAEVWLTPTGSDIWDLGSQLKLTTRMVLSHSKVSHVISYTEQFAAEIKVALNLDRRIDCIYPSLDFARFVQIQSAERSKIRSSIGLDPDAFVISCHCNMRPVKRPTDVIRIASCVSGLTSRTVVLLLIGPSMVFDPQHVGLARIVQTGIVADVVPFLHASDVEVNCSTHDSFNLSLAESMSCGLPVVSSDVVGIAKEIKECSGGILFDVAEVIDDSHSGVRFLVELAENEELREEVGRRASLHIRDIMDPRKIAAKYARLLECGDDV